MGIDAALRYWGLDGSVASFGDGYINDTFLVGGRFVVQRVNERVFPNAEALMRNVSRVADALGELGIHPLRVPDRSNPCRVSDGSLWRVSPYVKGRCFRQVPEELVEPAGEAFGTLLNRLAACDVSLEPAVPGYHDIDHYLAIHDTLEQDAETKPEREFVELQRHRVPDYSTGKQIIHGDCKVDNLIFHPRSPRVLKIVDLDTLMQGHPAFDFGDFVRSACTAVGNAEWQGMMKRGKSAIAGFFRPFQLPFRAVRVSESMALAPAHMSFMLGLRFLNDHCQGDRYFKVRRRGENLERARAQFRLCEAFRTGVPDLSRWIEDALD